MLFMIIERFKGNDMLPACKRVQDEGRVTPIGVNFPLESAEFSSSIAAAILSIMASLN